MYNELINKFKIGESFNIQKKIDEKDAALNYGSGKLDTLLATPSLVALMIEASVKLLDEKLPEGFVTVGIKSYVEHEKPSVLGATVSVEVEIKEFDGKKIFLQMLAFDEVGEIGKGYHERIIVNKKALLKKASERSENILNKNY